MATRGLRRIATKDFWIRETFAGYEYRKRTKTLVSVLFLGLAPLTYYILTIVGELENGPQILRVAALTLGVLLITLVFLVIMISLIEYLRGFEE